MILVTGSEGFIGKHLVEKLQEMHGGIVGSDPRRDCLSVEHFIGSDCYEWEAVFHLGAISDTTCTDWPALNENNFVLSKKLGRFCMERKIPFIYASSASVYGNGRGPLNDYATSKMMVDQWASAYLRDFPWYGCRFFNVYGPGEAHKGKQASLVHQIIQTQRDGEKPQLFATDTVRDFVYVDDVVDVMIWMWRNKPPAGIYDVGTGEGVSICKMHDTIEHEMNISNSFDEIEMPAHLVGKYQFHTCADIRMLRQAGYDKPFTPLHQGIWRMLK